MISRTVRSTLFSLKAILSSNPPLSFRVGYIYLGFNELTHKSCWLIITIPSFMFCTVENRCVFKKNQFANQYNLIFWPLNILRVILINEKSDTVCWYYLGLWKFSSKLTAIVLLVACIHFMQFDPCIFCRNFHLQVYCPQKILYFSHVCDGCPRSTWQQIHGLITHPPIVNFQLYIYVISIRYSVCSMLLLCPPRTLRGLDRFCTISVLGTFIPTSVKLK